MVDFQTSRGAASSNVQLSASLQGAAGSISRALCGTLKAALLWAFVAAGALAPSYAHAQDVRLEKLTIVTKSGPHVFQVEVMRKPQDLMRGLMFRRSLAPNRGMLFDFGAVKPVAMWMRNTYLPLDMVFIDQRGIVANFAENTEPLSETPIPSARPVLAVLEVIAGTARKIGLKPGDRIEYRLFKAK